MTLAVHFYDTMIARAVLCRGGSRVSVLVPAQTVLLECAGSQDLSV